MRAWMRTLGCAGLMAGLAACAAAPSPTAADGRPRAKVDGGVIVGASSEDIVAFKGVPFAAPPVGDLRWKPPQKVAAWTGDRPATDFGPACMQPVRNGMKVSEDCLYLNVYAPKGAKALPVMVWIHGGSNLTGVGSVYNGPAFAKSGVVYVSLNYRMGAMGFFAHPAITQAAAKDEPLGSYGLMDQTAALQWVQRNIGAFGGDPKRVTVFGESAGAINIYALLGLKTSKGLFSQAILESNINWGDSNSLATAERAGEQLATKAGAAPTASVAELRKISADALIAAQSGPAPIVDGRFMTETALQALAGKRTLDVPMIVGTNAFEASLVQNSVPEAAWQDWTDSWANAPARFIAAKSADGKPAWLYYFSYIGTAQRSTAKGAAHATELSYVYNGSNRTPEAADLPGAPPRAESDEDMVMAKLMHSCWVAFAKTGAPTCASGPAWPRYDAKTDQLMEFGMSSGVRTNFRKAELDKATAAQAGAR